MEASPAAPMAELEVAAVRRRFRVHPVVEHELLDVPLDDLLDGRGRLVVNEDVEAKGYFTVQLARGAVRLQARGFVGLIPLNDRVVIDVRPRVPVRNLGRILRISGHVPRSLGSERRYRTQPEWNESLVDLYAGWLVDRLEVIASEGLLRDYVRREDASSFPRGRIRTDATLTRLRASGVRHKAVSSWFERSADNAPNRCLKYAIWFLAGRLSEAGSRMAGRRELLQRLGALFELFSFADLDHSLAFVHDPLVTGAGSLPSLRDYYRPALDLALMVVRQHAVDMEAKKKRSVELPSIVLDMDKVFEGYLRNLLREEAVHAGRDEKVLDGNTDAKKPLFDRPPSEPATPDIVFRGEEGGCPLIIEVKNVPVKNASKRSALEQAITYAASYRCETVVLAHPCSSSQESGLRIQGRIGGLAVHQFIFDLGATDLAKEEEQFKQEMFSLVSNPKTAANAVPG
jgi:5-methylcytosine-specific restriction enzyme subunit McrC